MELLRNLVAGNRTLACILLLATLLMKAVIPVGYMVDAAPRSLFISVCSDASGAHTITQVAVPVKGETPDGHGAAKKDCPFSSLGSAALAGADATLLTAALVFILALGFGAVPILRLQGRHHLRPPLRGPPAVV